MPSASPDDIALAAGLTSKRARQMLAEFGPNSIASENEPRWRAFIGKFWSPIPWLLEFAIVLQIALGRHLEAGLIASLLLFNATLSFVQEGRAGAALAALRKRLAPTALVRRDGAWTRRPTSELVRGDIISLVLGALVPADARIVSGAGAIDQSTLTGESAPISAGPGDIVYAGSLVRQGQALAEVTATGPNTYYGRTVELVRLARGASTEQKAILGVTRNLAVINGIVAALVVAYGFGIGLPKDDLIRLALTAVLATVPLALPATFTLSAAVAAQALARRGVLLTRFSAAHEAAAMDVLCVDKTGTLTRNEMQVVEVTAMTGFERPRVLPLAALASSESNHDPIDVAVLTAAGSPDYSAGGQRMKFVPFDPVTRTSEALVICADGTELRVVKGAFEAVSAVAVAPAEAQRAADDLAAKGHRVIAVAAGPAGSLRIAGLVAISDPPREDSAALIARLRDDGVRTVMVTGDSRLTATAIARKVGLGDEVCAPDRLLDPNGFDKCGVFARVLPEQKFRLVHAFQQAGHVVGMCGDGVNDAPALRQAQFGIAVSTATDAAKAAAGAVLTESGLGGIAHAVREGRIGFQRLLSFVLNMLVKKTEIVMLLAVGLALTGAPVLTPTLMVLLFVTNDLLSMSLTTDRASPALAPSVWRMRNITAAGVTLGLCKLAFSTAMLAVGKYKFSYGPAQLQTLAFATIVFSNQTMLYVLRERRRLWSSMPGIWVIAASAAGLALVAALASIGVLMAPLPWQALIAVFAAAVTFALVLDQIKAPVMRVFKAV